MTGHIPCLNKWRGPSTDIQAHTTRMTQGQSYYYTQTWNPYVSNTFCHSSTSRKTSSWFYRSHVHLLNGHVRPVACPFLKIVLVHKKQLSDQEKLSSELFDRRRFDGIGDSCWAEAFRTRLSISFFRQHKCTWMSTSLFFRSVIFLCSSTSPLLSHILKIASSPFA